MKKICFITTIPGTLESFVSKTAEYLHNSGEFDVTFVCDADDRFAESLPDYIHYRPVPMKRGINLGGIKAIRQMKKLFKEEKFDIVQYSTPNASLYASIAAKSAKIPVRLYCQWGIVYVAFSGIKRKIFKCIEKKVCKLSTWIEPDSFGNLRFSRAEGLYNESKSSVIWNGSAMGVDTSRFDINKKDIWNKEVRTKYAIPDDAFVYGFVGRVTTDKGINELLESFGEISKTNKDAYLVLVGRREKNINEQLLAEAEKNERVIFVGSVDDPERYYACMDVFVLPSYREGFGSSVIEAEAMGVPVIVTDIPGPVDAMSEGKTGLIVKKADVESLKSAMLSIYNDDKMRNDFASNTLEFVKNRFEQKQLLLHILKDRKRLLGDK